MGPRAGLDGRKISSPPVFDPGPSSPQPIAIPTELPGLHSDCYWVTEIKDEMSISTCDIQDRINKRGWNTRGKVYVSGGIILFFF